MRVLPLTPQPKEEVYLGRHQRDHYTTQGGGSIRKDKADLCRPIISQGNEIESSESIDSTNWRTSKGVDQRSSIINFKCKKRQM